MPGDEADRASDRLRRVVALATAGMVALSWPLWAGTHAIPRVPFAGRIPVPPLVADLNAALVLLAAVAGAGLARQWRPWYAISTVVLVWLVLLDQHRFQPWAYQYLMVLLPLAALPRGEGLRYARWWLVALYVHSGLSKLDVSFCDGLGLAFLRAALEPFGLYPSAWPTPWRRLAVLTMPLGEIAVAAALAWPRARRVGRVGAVLLHATLVVILGPIGLGHSLIVLTWNAAMAAEVWVAFGPELAAGWSPGRGTWAGLPVKAVFLAGVLLPLGERWGVFDAWPSHALYASHVGRVDVYLHAEELERWPPPVRAYVRAGQGTWRRLDLTAWSRDVRGTPLYPQERAWLGLAEGLAARYGGRLVRVVMFGPADRWRGRRRREEAIGLTAIRALGDRFLLNAHPAPRDVADGDRSPPGG